MKTSSRTNLGKAFTLIELLVVITIIVVLAGLVVAGAGHAQKEGARARAKAEIAALSTALESYKADNGIYPPATGIGFTTGSGATAGYNSSPTGYEAASLILYKALSGDNTADRTGDVGYKTYFEFQNNQLEPFSGTGNVTAILDPFGYSYGYSTIYTDDTDTPGTKGYNPTFDLWSTGGKTNQAYNDGKSSWLTNW